jgi:hypothetical protein
MSMATSDVNIIRFMAAITRAAKVIVPKPTDQQILCVILRGLLPEFSDIKLVIESRTPATTLAAAKLELTNHANSHGLHELTSGGNAAKRDKSFHAGDATPPIPDKRKRAPRKGNKIIPGVDGPNGKPWMGLIGDCQRFLQGHCPSGNACRYNPADSSKSGSAGPTKPPTKPQPPASPRVDCNYCGDDVSDPRHRSCPSEGGDNQFKTDFAFNAFLADDPHDETTNHGWVTTLFGFLATILGFVPQALETFYKALAGLGPFGLMVIAVIIANYTGFITLNTPALPDFPMVGAAPCS